jgi:hypothetical protein
MIVRPLGQILWTYLLVVFLCCGGGDALATSPADALSCAKFLVQQTLRPIPYESPEGQIFIKKCNVPPPSIHFVPLAQIEPDRRVAAREWTSPYCLRWNDGCEQCTRSNLVANLKCNLITTIRSHCQRHAVLCNDQDSSSGSSDAIDYSNIERMCSQFITNVLEISAQGTTEILGGVCATTWEFELNRWHADLFLQSTQSALHSSTTGSIVGSFPTEEY